jgi:protein TonB
MAERAMGALAVFSANAALSIACMPNRPAAPSPGDPAANLAPDPVQRAAPDPPSDAFVNPPSADGASAVTLQDAPPASENQTAVRNGLSIVDPHSGRGGPLRDCDGGLVEDGAVPHNMVKPPLEHVPTVVYTEEAMEKRSGGIALVSCIVELDGSTSNCRILRGVPYMNEAILTMMQSFRYAGPIRYCDQPVRVNMIIPIRIPIPR